MATVATCAVPEIIPPSALGADGAVAPSNRVAVGCIGVGPQGRGDMGNFLALPEARVVALCDVAQRNLEQALNQVNQHYHDQGCATYNDYRELLARNDIDAVLVATPDHWHVPVALAAARAGKDIYLEKPMGLTVADDLLLRKTVQRRGRIFQFGTQQRSSGQFRLACELVRNGRIGQLQQVNVWAPASRPGGSTTPTPVPAGLNYDFWLGPAPESPYTADKCFDDGLPGGWKTWWYISDYALGFVAGWGVHPLDIAYWGHPAMMKGSVELEGKGIFPKEGACNTAVAWDVHFSFADGVRLRYKGAPNGYGERTEMNDLRPWEQKYAASAGHGTAFEGTEGWVMVDRSTIHTSPEKLVEEKFGSSDLRLVHSDHHARNFIQAVKSRQPAICPIQDAVQADLLCHLSDIAIRLDRKLIWDAPKERFVSDREANERLRARKARRAWGV